MPLSNFARYSKSLISRNYTGEDIKKISVFMICRLLCSVVCKLQVWKDIKPHFTFSLVSDAGMSITFKNHNSTLVAISKVYCLDFLGSYQLSNTGFKRESWECICDLWPVRAWQNSNSRYYPNISFFACIQGTIFLSSETTCFD